MSLDTTSIEEIVIKTVMEYPEAFDAVSGIVQAKDFSNPKHRTLWRVIVDLIALRRTFDITSVFHSLTEKGLFDSIGGNELKEYFEFQCYSSISGIEARCQRIREISLLRMLRQASDKIIELVDDHQGRSFSDLLSEAEGIFSEITSSNTGNEIVVVNGKEMMQEVLREYVDASLNPGIKGVSTGIQSLDEQSDGLQKGEMVIVAGPPSMGKTAFAVNLIQNALYTTELPVVIFSMEMPVRDIGRRMWSTESKINYQHIRRGKVDEIAAARLTPALVQLSNPLLKITSHSPLTPSRVRSVLKKINREHGGVRMAMIDYVQLMDSDKKSGNRNEELTLISRELKRMALEFNMPFIVLSQLTKAVETAKRKPTNGDLRESGALAQDADMIMMVHRQEKYDEADQAAMGKAEIIITKSRNGKTGTVTVGFDGSTFRFYELNKNRDYEAF